MSRFVILSADVGEHKRGSIVDTNEVKVKAGKHVTVPSTQAIVRALNKMDSTWVINYSPRTGKFVVGAFRFGLPYRTQYPIFEQGVVVRLQTITATRHVRVQSTDIKDCIRRMFRLCQTGKLFAYAGYSPSEMERLVWNADEQCFDIELVKKKTVCATESERKWQKLGE